MIIIIIIQTYIYIYIYIYTYTYVILLAWSGDAVQVQASGHAHVRYRRSEDSNQVKTGLLPGCTDTGKTSSEEFLLIQASAFNLSRNLNRTSSFEVYTPDLPAKIIPAQDFWEIPWTQEFHPFKLILYLN